MLYINDRLSIPIDEFEFSFARSPGPGGQNVNKVNSKATLRWNITQSPTLPNDVQRRLARLAGRRLGKQGVLIVTSHRYRDQSRNVADCLAKLRELVVAAATPPPLRRATRPTAGSQRRRKETKRRQSEKKSARRFTGRSMLE